MSTTTGGRSIIHRIRSSRSRILKNNQRNEIEKIPSMKEFIHRQKVIRQYRGFLRALKMIDDESFREDGRNEVKRQFRGMKCESGALSVSMAVKDGERRLKDLMAMVGYQEPSRNDKEIDSDSWLNIIDEDDPRGRVGVQWPWENKKE
mmetsp:Transcript_5013/g.9527  ORF Transcript_5013/g.9527 Transcript_5013/m.9527 type:complete len:148 (+) Transcript_5013:164-607(+)